MFVILRKHNFLPKISWERRPSLPAGFRKEPVDRTRQAMMPALPGLNACRKPRYVRSRMTVLKPRSNFSQIVIRAEYQGVKCSITLLIKIAGCANPISCGIICLAPLFGRGYFL
jgi:hypothetical protein